MEILELKAEIREAKGKNRVNKLRNQGKLPANVYGHDAETRSLSIDAREFLNVTRSGAGTHVILRLLIDGAQVPAVIVKEIQRHPTRDELVHVDFFSVALNEKITAAVPVNIVGDSIGVREGGILQHGVWEVQIEALPTDLPDHIDVDVSDLGTGQSIHAGEISLPGNLAMMSPAEEVVVSILAPVKAEAEAEEAGVAEAAPEAEEGAAASEGSGES